ncbi:MAG: DUF2510 domain-containing protein [Patulibacter minatonensis]
MNPAAGWFPDPHAPNFLRWWDGAQWTQHVHPAAPAAGAAHQGAALRPAQPFAHGAASSPASHTGAPQHGQSGIFSPGLVAGQAHGAHGRPTMSGAAAAVGSGVGASGVDAVGARLSGGDESIFRANPKSFLAVIVSAIYLLLAITSGIVLIGIVPAFAAFHAVERREKLAPIAVLAAVLAVGFALTHVQRA